MDVLRMARLLKFDGSGPTSNPSAALGAASMTFSDGPSPNPSAALGTAPSVVTASAAQDPAVTDNPKVATGVTVSIPFQAYDALCNLLSSMKQILENLPEAIAKALEAQKAAPVATPEADITVVPSTSMANVPSTSMANVPSTSMAVVPAANSFGANGAGPDKNLCGVCHMEVNMTAVWAFKPCGHFPFCSPCMEGLKGTMQNKECPFCTNSGDTVRIRIEAAY